MSNLTQVGEVLAADWERQKADVMAVENPRVLRAPETDEDCARFVESADARLRLANDEDREFGAWCAKLKMRQRQFIIDWPALARWRDGVLREPRKYPSYIVAAALEALALECALSGYDELAQKARGQAEAVMLGRRNQPPLEEPYAT